MGLNNQKRKIKSFGKKLFSKYFGFETGIDITNDVAVLYRRNVVIKNIVFISNLLYSLVFFVLGFSVANPTTDWIFAIAALPITYTVGKLQSKLIDLDHNDLTKQQIAMYVSSFWIFISAVLVYIRIYAVGQNAPFETASYVLIYYALVQISLYQDKRLLSNSFVSLLGFITLIHIAVTYNFFTLGLTWQEFASQLFKDPILATQIGDLALRTVIFALFYLVNYIIVSIGQSIQEERKSELSKRREVQKDFSHIVRSLFNVVFQSANTLLDAKHAYRVASVANRIATYYHLNETDKLEMEKYALLHLRFDEIKDLMVETENYDEQTYEILKQKTDLGSKIGKRIQLAQKCNDIIRAHYEGNADEQFIEQMVNIQKEIPNQIILLADCYVSLRSLSTYYHPNNHPQTLNIFKKELTPYFDYDLRETFLKYNTEIDQLYHDL
ncbi:hypothetical protein [Acholeplasma granularum]|uniref:hypothetical protein n=1 Tax=Acholeplasma granularum TaxID=264635 RepID=UPI0004719220|nr:hypothetical protein [Acholeplasma granularum]